MKLSLVALLGTAAALSVGVYHAYRVADPSVPAALGGSLPPPASVVEIPPPPAAVAAPTVADTARTADGTHKELAALREEVALLGAELSGLKRTVREQSRTLARTVADEDPAANEPQAKAAAQEQEERLYQERMASVEADFWGESADPGWAVQATATVQEALAGDEAMQAAVHDVECRSRSCRLEIADDGASALAKSIPFLATRLAATLPDMTTGQVEDGNGGKTTILYLSRGTK
jgi:hypothetical protein